MQTTSATPTESDPQPWISRRWFTASGALVAELRDDIEPLALFERLSRQPHCLFLDSAVLDGAGHGESTPDRDATESPATPRLGRFSYIAADPIHSIHVEAANDGHAAARVNEAFSLLRSMLAEGLGLAASTSWRARAAATPPAPGAGSCGTCQSQTTLDYGEVEAPSLRVITLIWRAIMTLQTVNVASLFVE